VKFSVFGVGLAGLGSAIDGLQAHLAHESLGVLAVNLMALVFQLSDHAAAPVERSFRIDFIYTLHEQDVLCVVTRAGIVVEGGARQSEQLALPCDGQRGVIGVDESASLVSAKKTFF
jgi:hypothetical protein